MIANQTRARTQQQGRRAEEQKAEGADMAKTPLVYDPEKYTYRVIWSDEDHEHVGLCTEFPSLSHLADTPGKALKGIVALVIAVLEDMSKSKETPPMPLSLQQFKGNIAVRVPPERHRELVMEAADAGVSLNRLISDKLAR
jgi:predicted HicB family RNase H-like nuclease